jgi:hypothetical protein
MADPEDTDEVVVNMTETTRPRGFREPRGFFVPKGIEKRKAPHEEAAKGQNVRKELLYRTLLSGENQGAVAWGAPNTFEHGRNSLTGELKSGI